MGFNGGYQKHDSFDGHRFSKSCHRLWRDIMSIKKTYFKTKPTCRLTFRLPGKEAGDAKAVNLVGEFNKWNTQKTKLKHLKNGDFKVELELDAGKEYQFRYLIDQSRWTNDPEADKTAHTPFPDSVNSVVVT